MPSSSANAMAEPAGPPQVGGRGFRSLTVVSLLMAMVALLLAACGPTSSDAFVKRSGTSFTVDGAPFRFVGYNLYDGAASDIFSCSPSTRLDDTALADTLRAAREEGGATVIRFWAFATYTADGSDFSGMDRFIAAARREGLRVMPVLEDGPGNCSTGERNVPLSQVDGGQWYSGGYRQPLGRASISYRDYARLVAEHYRDEPAILGWTMVNEAETSERQPDGRTPLVAFAGDMAAVLHQADPNHLVTLGTQGNGAPGNSGSDFHNIYVQAGLDFTEVHDWNRYGSDTEALPGSVDGRLPAPDSDECRSRTARVACSFAISRAIDKPIVVGEVGITATDGPSRQRRASLITAKARAAFSAGGAGYLVWHLDRGQTDRLDVQTSPLDPVVPALARVASELNRT
ncbi:MAG: cellulase family glycosylhydrolase [Humibacillus sp.]|nr:cellulase family glycosylhydrolase [Humibacillus sp.]MDN5778013.1 cellulase family glycosylhydrolase [Humibacillus sp.]